MSSSCSQSPFIYRPKVDTSLPSWRDPAAKEGMRRLLLEATIRLTCTFTISAARIRSLVPTYSIAPKLAFDILSRLKQGRNLNSLIPKGSLLYRKTVTVVKKERIPNYSTFCWSSLSFLSSRLIGSPTTRSGLDSLYNRKSYAASPFINRRNPLFARTKCPWIFGSKFWKFSIKTSKISTVEATKF